MINIIALWTSEIDAGLEHNIMSCFNETFSQTKDPNYFQNVSLYVAHALTGLYECQPTTNRYTSDHKPMQPLRHRV